MLQASLSILFLWMSGAAAGSVPVSLDGSAESMERQHRIAVVSGYEFFRRASDVDRAVEAGTLVELEQTASLALKHPRQNAGRPETKHFLEKLADDMHSACGERLVITSLTRPLTRQPRNAHRLSVHPAGMATDLRVPRSSRCRSWLEGRLLDLEAEGVLDVTRERSPAHYHLALFPNRYLEYLGLRDLRRLQVVTGSEAAIVTAPAPLSYFAPRHTR